jgi:formylglycine-generating enzyme required for sulfatase activity
MGCENCGMPDALPVHLVAVEGFWMDRTPVTNAEFTRFVKATGYLTVAERPLDPRDFPGVPRHKLVPGSAVFSPTPGPVPLDNPLQWWRYTPGANWKHPDGPRSDLRGRLDHPVVHVAFEDVVAYAKWANKRLPTEAEFEFAARGGLDRNRFLLPGQELLSLMRKEEAAPLGRVAAEGSACAGTASSRCLHHATAAAFAVSEASRAPARPCAMRRGGNRRVHKERGRRAGAVRDRGLDRYLGRLDAVASTRPPTGHRRSFLG